jgi:internalin A
LSMPRKSTSYPQLRLEPEKRIAKWRTIGHSIDQPYGAKTEILDLSQIGLTDVPNSLRTVPHVELLDLGRNMIKALPPWIGELPELKAIDLGYNRLRALPKEIGLLRKLKDLGLNNNEMETLPKEITRLPLEYLLLNGNPNLGVPESILAGVTDPKSILEYYFLSRHENGRPLLELKLLVVGRGKAGKTTLVKRLAGERPLENDRGGRYVTRIA